MGLTTMMKAVLLLAWMCMVGAQHGGSAVFFPDEVPKQSSPVANNRQTSQISNKPRCTNGLEENEPCIADEDYNSFVRDRFRHLLHRFRGNEVVTNEVFQALSKPENIDFSPPPPPPPPQTRMGFITESPVCAAEETIIYPKRARTQNEEWVFVLNQGNTKQGVRVEKCISNNQPCRLGAARTEVETVCRQKYIYKKLLVMNGEGTDIVPESVLMPSCCVCYIKAVVEDEFFFDFRRSSQNQTTTTTLSEDSDSDKDHLTTENPTMEETTLDSMDKQPIEFQSDN